METTNNTSDKSREQNVQDGQKENPMLQVKTAPMPTKLEFAEKKEKKHSSDDK